MCFVLYAATTTPLPRNKWELGSPNLPVESLGERDSVIKVHFSNPEVQYVGSTSSCGCDFPNAMFQGGGWPECEYSEVDEAVAETSRLNCEALVRLLRSTGDTVVELYGVWAGNYSEAPRAFEAIPVEAILKEGFMFKERGFYQVQMDA
jgi:hypothetical protein